MAVNLKLGDRLAIIRDGVKKGYTPQEAMLQYQINKDGGYNNWKNQFKLTTGINPDLDDTYNYELFFKENPEAAKQLILGKVSPDILQMYKTPLAIQREKQVLQQRQKGNANSLMDYAQYEKLINDYMNKSVNMYSCGGPISINMYAEGTSELATSDNSNVTELGIMPERWVSSVAPDFIEVTPEELLNFKRVTMNVPDIIYEDEGVPQEYKDVASKHTKWVSIPWDYLEENYPSSRRSKNSDHTTYYMLEDVDTDNPKQYYRLYRVRESTPEGRAYNYWKNQQAYENRLSKLYQYNYGDGEWVDIGTSEVLPEVTVAYNPQTGNYVQLQQEEIPTSEYTSKPIADSIPISETSPYAQGNSEISYYNPFNAPDGELNVPNNNPYGTEGVSGGSSFGSGTEGIRMPDIFDMNVLDLPYTDFQYTPYLWQLEDLEYLNPPGYVPIPNWNVALVYDTGTEGADFADFLKMLAGYGRDNSLRDELMAKLFEPKDYFADPYAGSHYTDTQSFYDAYNNNPYNKIQRESNGIPLYANGGLINIFGPGGFTYIPDNQQNMVVNPFEFEGIRYGWLPNGGAGEDVYSEHNDRNGVYVRWDNDNNKWAKTTVPRDLGNIKNYFAGRHNELATYDDNAQAANAYDPYNNPAISAQLNNLFNNDPVIKELRRRFNDMAVANRTLGRNNWLEGVGIAMTPFNLVMPSNVYGAIAKLFLDLNEYASAKRENRIPNINGNFFDYLLGGNNLGFAQTTQGTRDWAEQHPYLNMGVNLVGDAITGYGIMKGVKAAKVNNSNVPYIPLTVDENGNMLMAHGSPNKNISKFRIDPNTNKGFNDGIYFTDPETAKQYTGMFGRGKIYNVEYPYSNKNVAVIEGNNNSWVKIPEQSAANGLGISTDELHNIIGFYNDTRILPFGKKPNYYAVDLLVKAAREKGFDAVHFKQVKDRGKRMFGKNRTQDLFVVFEPEDVVPKQNNLNKDIKLGTQKSMDLDTNSMQKSSMTSEDIIKNVAKKAKKDVLQYLESEEHILQIMKSGVSRKEAEQIANEMYINAEGTHGPIIEDLKVEGRQGKYRNSFGPVDELYNNGPELPIEDIIDNDVWTFKPEYYIDPYARSYYETAYHELGGHGATLGYDPNYVQFLNSKHPKLGSRYLETMQEWFPHYLKVYEHNAKLKPIRKPEFKSSVIDTELEKKLKYLEDVDEYSARARAARIDKGYKLGLHTKDVEMLYKYFTKESVDNLIENVIQLAIPISVGYNAVEH